MSRSTSRADTCVNTSDMAYGGFTLAKVAKGHRRYCNPALEVSSVQEVPGLKEIHTLAVGIPKPEMDE